MTNEKNEPIIVYYLNDVSIVPLIVSFLTIVNPSFYLLMNEMESYIKVKFLVQRVTRLM